VNGSIYLAATTYKVPDVTLSLRGPEVVVEIRSQEVLSTVSVLFYKPGEARPVAGIASEGYTYSGIATIAARVWNINKSSATVAFTMQDVAEKLAPGKLCIGCMGCMGKLLGVLGIQYNKYENYLKSIRISGSAH